MKKLIAFALVAMMSVAITGCMGKVDKNTLPEETSVTEETTAVTDEHTISIDFEAIEKENEVKTILKSVKRISVTEKYDGEITGKTEYYLDDEGHIANNNFIGSELSGGFYDGFSFSITPEEDVAGVAYKNIMSADPYYYDEVNLSTLILYSREYYDINVDNEKIVFSVDIIDDYVGETVSLTVTVDKKTMRILEMTDGEFTVSYSYENKEPDRTIKNLFDGEKSTATIIFNGHDIGNNEYTETFIVEYPKGWTFIPDELYIFNPYYDEAYTSPVDIGTFAPTGDYTLYLTDAMG